MSQSDTTASTRFSLLPGSITRFFLLLIVVLLVMMGVMVQSAVNTWLKDKSYQIVDITHAIHKRVDTWRYVTWQIYDNIAATASSPGAEGLQETRLKQDVYYLEKPRRKTEALIFGSHDSSTLEMTQRISTYLDTLWGAENVPWSMYYLNGQDNSLILISTLPLKDLTSGFKESTIGNIVLFLASVAISHAHALHAQRSGSFHIELSVTDHVDLIRLYGILLEQLMQGLLYHLILRLSSAVQFTTHHYNKVFFQIKMFQNALYKQCLPYVAQHAVAGTGASLQRDGDAVDGGDFR